MSTVQEIESAIETLSPEKVEALFQWLQSRKEKLSGIPNDPAQESLIGFMKGKIILKPGWDEPLEDFKEYME